ncbi:hypothetical protein JMJ58_18550 [Haloterrigena salifodinae]|uniref:Uncharacterized protein n=1 Tax=Haloterrigena salifodinae TaxID=2675099 RepID=A0A8T8E0F7_9EURY|nr:hypothetical protein [Haloterrigena salifodinae]QRV14891.1 hypothetical protein JMJ58_18550 [Haloterrigena salifodinae]
MGEEEFRECVDETFEKFRKYDQYVDIVSCWEHFLTEQYKTSNSFYFNRYPTYSPESSNSVTPSFSVLFNREYGVIFDANQRLPKVESKFEEKLSELEQYDQELAFRTGGENRIIPDQHDIALVIHEDHFQTEKLRINNALDSGKLDLDSNIILLNYSYIDQDTNPKYRFQRASMVGDNFRDESLPDEKQMSVRMSMQGGSFESIDIPARAFYDRKATGVLFNEQPPSLYLACYMWQTVFYDLLEDDQRIVWQRGDPQKILDITVEVDELTKRLNHDYIPNGGVKESWVDNTLEYMCITETAEKISSGTYYVKYRNLIDKRREYKDILSGRSEHSDLAQLFAEWHCENVTEMESGEIEELTDPDPSKAPDGFVGDLTQPELGEF